MNLKKKIRKHMKRKKENGLMEGDETKALKAFGISSDSRFGG